jgi:hypothetical protein
MAYAKDLKKKLNKEYEKEKEENAPVYLGLELSQEQKDDLVKRVLFDVDQDEKARVEFLDRVVECLDLYEGKVTATSQRFEGEVHVSSRVTTMTVETLHSILYPTIWNEDLHYWVARQTEDIPVADLVNKFMDWDLTYTHMAQFADDWTKQVILEGTCVTKVRWCQDWGWKQEKKPKVGSIMKKLKRMVKDAMSGKETEVEIEKGDFDVVYTPDKEEYCDVDIIPLEDVGFPPFNSPKTDVDDLDHIWHRTHPFLYEIAEKEQRGFIEAGVTKKVGSCVEEEMSAPRPTTAQRMQAEGSQELHYEKHNTPLDLVEWYGKYELADGEYEDIIVWVEQKTETFCAATCLRNVSHRGHRPFQISQFIRRAGRLYGISAAELVREFQKVLDEMMSINVNAAKMAVYPPGFYRAASGFDPEKITVQPGVMIPVDDINDAKWVNIPNNVLPTSQEMKFILELVEKITSIGAYQTGQESGTVGTRATARGTLALISQGERRFAVLGKRMQYQLAKIMEMKLEYYQENLNSKMFSKVMGENMEQLFPEGLQADDLIGEFGLFMSLDSTGGSKSLKQEQSTQIYSAYMQNPLVMQDPSRIWEVSSMPLKEAGLANIEGIIGPKPPSMEEQQQMMQQQQQQGGAQGAPQQEGQVSGAGQQSVPPPSQQQTPPAAPTEPAPSNQ